MNHPTLVALAQEASCTSAQAVFRLAQNRGIIPLAGTTNEDRMKQAADAENVNLEVGTGSKKGLEALNALIGAM